MDATMLLCDFAEAVNGKLYIMGGGWTDLRGPALLNCSVALKVDVRWNETNEKHTLSLTLLDEDGAVVSGPDERPIRIEGEFEVGRPTGSIPGADLTNTMAFRFEGLDLPTGAYRFVFDVDEIELSAASFRVVRPA